MKLYELNKTIPDYKTRKKIIHNMCSKFKFVFPEIIGKSVCQREITALRVGNKSRSTIWIGAHHGMEWISSAVLLNFLIELCEKIYNKDFIINGINILECLDKRGLTIIPCLNPDGVEISLYGPSEENITFFNKEYSVNKDFFKNWQANSRGVDLNHNYNAGWEELHKLEIKNGITHTCATRYGGTNPESEPETIAITNYCRENFFTYAIAFHSQGEEIYWDYENKKLSFSENFAKIFALSSGYKMSFPEGLAVGGGFKDWFISKINRPAFTIELGKGKNPLSINSFSEVYNKIRNALYTSALMNV